jgi:hypothetical protein
MCPTLEQLQDVVKAAIVLLEIEDDTVGLSISLDEVLKLLCEAVGLDATESLHSQLAKE